MKIFSTTKILVTLTSIMLVAACGPKAQIENQRFPVLDLNATFGSQKSNLISPLVSSLESSPLLACDRLNALAQESKYALKYSFFDSMKTEWKKGENENFHKEIKGSISIAENPLTQFILGEKFIAGSTKDFYEKAKAEREAGNLGFLKWMVVKILNGVGALEVIQYSTVNDKLVEAFPGIYGGQHDVRTSLQYSLLKKVADPEKVAGRDGKILDQILTKKLSLFPASGSWSDWADASKENWASTIAALRKNSDSPEEQKQRVCAMVLAHHSFAQLMTIKGYFRPEWKMSDEKKLVVKELAKNYQEFAKFPVSGGFFDTQKNTSIVLDTVAIQTYDPSQQILGISAELPNGKEQHQQGSLSDSLAMMEGLLYHFEASSPAAPWTVSERDYLFGDIQNNSSKAILPAEAHALSLGLMTIGFKNLAALHIKKVNAKGILAGEKDLVAGIAIASEMSTASPFVKLRLEDIIRFTKLVSYLESSMKNFRKANVEQWARMNAVYDRKTLASLHGDALFSKEELEKILNATERKTILKDNLISLKLPLAILMLQMGGAKSGCISEMQWNLESGEKIPTSSCSPSLRAEVKSALTILAQDTQSPLLMKRAEEL